MALYYSLTAKKLDAEQAEVAAHRLGLSMRELEVPELATSGLTAASIGRSLRISGRTVNKHFENAYRKLGAKSRIEAVERSRALGLVE